MTAHNDHPPPAPDHPHLTCALRALADTITAAAPNPEPALIAATRETPHLHNAVMRLGAASNTALSATNQANHAARNGTAATPNEQNHLTDCAAELITGALRTAAALLETFPTASRAEFAAALERAAKETTAHNRAVNDIAQGMRLQAKLTTSAITDQAQAAGAPR